MLRAAGAAGRRKARLAWRVAAASTRASIRRMLLLGTHDAGLDHLCVLG